MPKWIFVNVVVLLTFFAGALSAHESESAKYVGLKLTGLSPVFPPRRSTEN